LLCPASLPALDRGSGILRGQESGALAVLTGLAAFYRDLGGGVLDAEARSDRRHAPGEIRPADVRAGPVAVFRRFPHSALTSGPALCTDAPTAKANDGYFGRRFHPGRKSHVDQFVRAGRPGAPGEILLRTLRQRYPRLVVPGAGIADREMRRVAPVYRIRGATDRYEISEAKCSCVPHWR